MRFFFCFARRTPKSQVAYLNETQRLSVEQITAAFLVKLRTITEAQLGTTVSNVVVSVPPYFSDVQRKALRVAGETAGLHVLGIVNEDVAVGIAYGVYKKGQLPKPEEKPKLVAFVDLGHSAFTVSLMEFKERQVCSRLPRRRAINRDDSDDFRFACARASPVRRSSGARQ